jgi:hypothetical protein
MDLGITGGARYGAERKPMGRFLPPQMSTTCTAEFIRETDDVKG